MNSFLREIENEWKFTYVIDDESHPGWNKKKKRN